MSEHLSIVGAGGHGRVIADAANASGRWRQIDFYDDSVIGLSDIADFPVSGKLNALLALSPSASHSLIIGIGSNNLRVALQRQLESLGWGFASVVHPKAVVSIFSDISPGTVVMAGAIVNCGAKMGPASIINTGARIDHDCVLGEGVHVSPGAVLAGNVTVDEQCWIGAGSVLIEGVSMGAGSVLGAGSTAIRSIPANQMWAGSPASLKKQLTR